MRGLDAERSGQQAGRHHQHRADQGDIAERERQLQRGDVGIACRRRPAGVDIADRARDRDQHRERRRGRHRLMNRPAVKRHQEIGEQPAADAHQGRQQPDQRAIESHHKTARQGVAEPPGVAAEEEPYRGRPCDGDEHVFEQPLRRVARDHAAEDDAGDHRHRPQPQHVHVDGAAKMVRAKRADRGRDDDGKRGADAERHPHLQRHAGEPEALVKHRHQDGAAADAEHPGQKSGQRADHDQQPGELEQFGYVQPCDLHSRLPFSIGSCPIAFTYLPPTPPSS